ncbi:hypothetical protein KQI63_09915 [bacterium]|nr:hypothetical protein [bacterium]
MSEGPTPHADHDALAFMGAVTASVSHDLSNVLSTIDQVSGLIEDMLIAVERGVAIDPARLEMVQGRLAHQTKRGVTIVRKLNTLGHTTDDPVRQEDLALVFSTLLVLMERMASRRRIQVIFDPEQTGHMVEANPVTLYHLLYHALLLVMDSYSDGGDVTLDLVEEENSTSISIAGHDLASVEGGGDRLAVIHVLADQIGGKAMIDADDPGCLEVVLPRVGGTQE